MNSDKEKIVKYSQLYSRFLRLWTFIENFRLTTKQCLDLDSTRSHLRNFQKEGYMELIKDKDLRNAFSPIVDNEQKFNEILDAGVQEVIKSTKIPIEVASLVYMHSVLDALLFDLLECTADLDRNRWLQYIAQQKNDRRILPREIIEKSKAQLVDELLSKCLNRFRGKSIMRKCKRIFEICSSSKNCQFLPDYVYDEKKIKEIDDLRHDVIHGLKINLPIPDVEEKLTYLKRTALHFLAMIKVEFKLYIDLDIVRESFLQLKDNADC